MARFLSEQRNNYLEGKCEITSYYTPIANQQKYFNGSYAEDFKMNCSGDCLVTASGYRLTIEDKNQVIACDNSIYQLGTRVQICTPNKGCIIATCQDAGGAIKGGLRFDLWAGIGDENDVYKYDTKNGYCKILK